MIDLIEHIDWAWAVVNILCPPIVPMFGVLQVRRRLLTPAQKKRVTPLATIRDGQLAWISVLWNIGTVYELVEYSRAIHWFNGWMVSLLLAEFLLVVGGMSIAANGAVTAGYNDDDVDLLRSSIIVTVASGILFLLLHAKVHPYVD